MNKVKVEGRAMTVHSGQVKLTGDQAKTRLHAIALVGKPDKDGGGVYDVVSTLTFKSGEVFGYSGEVSKAGELRDHEAEALSKLEFEDRVRAEVRAEMKGAHEKAIARLEEVHKQALADQEARLRAELAPQA